MGIEKKAALVCVAVLALLFGIGLANRDHRPSNETAKAAMGESSSQRGGAILPDVKIDKGTGGAIVIPPRKDVGARPDSPAPAGYREVVVLARDNYWKIAKRELGDAALHRTVARANSGLDPKKLQVGQKILVPIDPNNDAVKGHEETPRVGASESAAAREYKVRKGESLSRIAVKVYGKEARWRDIWAANREAVPNPALLKAGTKLVIP